MLNCKKALPLWSAFFLACSLPLAAASCPDIKHTEQITVSHVYDGDTVRLSDGRRVRIIGINTPEMGRDGAPDEPNARAAKAYLQTLLTKGSVGLILGQQRQDRYKRWLGHLTVDKKLVAETMLQQGLGYQVVIPPNERFWRCLASAEKQAFSHKRGVWAIDPWRQISQLQPGEGGFRLLKGEVTAVRRKGDALLLDIDQSLRVRMGIALKPADISVADIDRLVGRKVRVSGWIKPKTAKSPKHFKPWFMVVKHQQHIDWQ